MRLTYDVKWLIINLFWESIQKLHNLIKLNVDNASKTILEQNVIR